MTNVRGLTSNKFQRPNNKNYDLEERTAKFGEEIILFVKTLKEDKINFSLIQQLVRSGTSVKIKSDFDL